MGYNDSLLPAQQLAIDETMTNFPSLRFYAYSDPVIILGKNQHPSIIKGDYPVARRMTGGTATLEMRDSFHWALSLPYRFGSLADMNAYICERLTRSMRAAGLYYAHGDSKTCTLKVHGKIVGSYARCLTKGNAFAHGAVALMPYSAQHIEDAIDLRPGEAELLSSMPDICSLMGRTAEDAKDILIESMLQAFTDGSYVQSQFQETEEYRQALKKHNDVSWIRNGKDPHPKREYLIVAGEEEVRNLRNAKGHCFYSMLSDNELEKMCSEVF